MDKQNYYKDLCEDEQLILRDIDKLNEELAAIQVLKRRHTLEKGNEKEAIKPDSFFVTPINVKPKKTLHRKKNHGGQLTAVEKVKKGLAALNAGTAREVGKKMVELFPTLTEDKAYGDAKFHLSKLYIKREIDAEPIAGTRSYLYKIKAA